MGRRKASLSDNLDENGVFGRRFFGVLGMSILYRVKVPSLPASGKD